MLRRLFRWVIDKDWLRSWVVDQTRTRLQVLEARVEDLESAVRLQGEALAALQSGTGEVEWAEATAPGVTRIPVGERKPPDWTGAAQALERKNMDAAEKRRREAVAKASNEDFVTRVLEGMPRR
jgi:hypothetical protein